MRKATESDEELVYRFQHGEPGHFDEIVRRHRQRLFRMALRSTGDAGEAEELVQEVFLRCWRGLADFDGDSKLTTWLYRIAWNLCADWHRRERRRALRVLPCERAEEIVDERENVEAALLAGEERRLLEGALGRLGSRYLHLITLFYDGGLSYAEIAEITGLPARTVETRLYRARRTLRKLLSERHGSGT